MSPQYTTKTAALKATKADINKLNTKSLKVNNKDVPTSVKHPNDTREVITENDLWGSWAEINKNGQIIFHNDEIIHQIGSGWGAWNTEITKVIDNKAYINDELFANIETSKITKANTSWQPYNPMFDSCYNLTEFSSSLQNLEYGYNFMYRCFNLTKVNTDLSSLKNGGYMFGACPISSFKCNNLNSLQYADYMFEDTSIKSFQYDLPSLTDGSSMFSYSLQLEKFIGDLSNLHYGNGMFYDCKRLTTVISDFSSLTSASNMFYGCSLNTDSLMYIAETIKPNNSNSPIHIGLLNSPPSKQDIELLKEIQDKGWQVFINDSPLSDFLS